MQSSEPALAAFQLSLKRTLTDNLGQCIKQLEASLDPCGKAYNDCLSLLTEFNRLERENMTNLLTREQYNQEFARLTQRTSSLATFTKPFRFRKRAVRPLGLMWP